MGRKGGGHTPQFGHADKGNQAGAGSGPSLSDAAPQGTGTAAAGVSADASRADHVHAITFGATVGQAPGTASNGSGTEPARANHVHPPLIRKTMTFVLANIPANATTALNVVLGDANYPQHDLIRAATLTGITCVLSGNPAGSNPVVSCKINGGATEAGLTLTITAGATRCFATTGTGVAVVSTDRVQAVITTDASWTATTVDITVELEFTETA